MQCAKDWTWHHHGDHQTLVSSVRTKNKWLLLMIIASQQVKKDSN